MRPAKRIRFRLLDAVLIACALGVLVFVYYRVRITLHYRWNWKFLPTYLVKINPDTGRRVPNLLLKGFFTTIRLSVWSIALGSLLGLAAGLFQTGKSLFLRLFGRAYVELIRNIPPLVLVFLFYFFFSSQLLSAVKLDDALLRAGPGTLKVLAFLFAPAARLSSFISAVITLALYEGAYIAEIVRAGISSVPKGQGQAAYSLGLSGYQQMRKVILPQAGKTILPALAGQFISAIKDSAIVSVISIPDLTFQGMEIMASTYRIFEIWITILAMYFILTYACSLLTSRLEKRLKG